MKNNNHFAQLKILVLLLCPLSSFPQQLYEIPQGTRTHWSSFENPTGNPGLGGKENKTAKGHAFDVIDPNGNKILLDIKGPGIIKRIWLTVNERSPKMLRSLRIEMYGTMQSLPRFPLLLGIFLELVLEEGCPLKVNSFLILKEDLLTVTYRCLSRQVQEFSSSMNPQSP